jgi:hypothetical protein
MNFNYSIEEHAGFFLSCHFRFAGWIGAVYVHVLKQLALFRQPALKKPEISFASKYGPSIKPFFVPPIASKLNDY